MTDAAHNRQIVVWDVPPTVPSGQQFSLKAGIKCDAQCLPANWSLAVRDQDGRSLAKSGVSMEPWPGTAALYFAEFELEAPDTVGQFRWQVVATAVGDEPADQSDATIVHEEAGADFNLRTVPEPDCRLTVVAVDREAQTPVPGLKVVVHPYRARTDKHGVAELDLPKGRFRLFVSGKNFFPCRIDAELTEDLTIRAELDIDLGPSDAELWS